jgi:hypothetical protein
MRRCVSQLRASCTGSKRPPRCPSAMASLVDLAYARKGGSWSAHRKSNEVVMIRPRHSIRNASTSSWGGPESWA